MLKNRDEVIENLADLMYELECERCPCDIDVYLYVDDGKGTLDTFYNPGGNSWLDDDHITVWTCKKWNGGDLAVLEEYQPDEIAWALDIELDKLKARVAKSLDCDVEDVDDSDIYVYVEQNDDLLETVLENYNEALKENVDYIEMAEEALRRNYDE